jgi:hypothetical protein
MGIGVMAWKEPETGKSGCGTAEMIAGMGGRAYVEGSKEGLSAGVLVRKCCTYSKPSHNTNCVNGRKELTHARWDL